MTVPALTLFLTLNGMTGTLDASCNAVLNLIYVLIITDGLNRSEIYGMVSKQEFVYDSTSLTSFCSDFIILSNSLQIEALRGEMSEVRNDLDQLNEQNDESQRQVIVIGLVLPLFCYG